MRPFCRLALIPVVALIACTEAASQAPPPDAPGGFEAAAPAAVKVETRRATSGVLHTTMEASGSIRARRVTAIASEVHGRLSEVFVDVGDVVEQGQPLFRIDPIPYGLALAEARAGLALARAESTNAIQEAERVKSLVERSAASEQHYDKLHTAAAVAKARVTQMEARVSQARRDFESALVVAPYAGSVVERRAHEGAMTGPEPIVILQETGALEVVLAVPESWPIAVRAGDTARLYAPGLVEPIETRIGRVSDRVDAETRTYEVRGPVRDSSRSLKAGSYVRAEIDLGSSEVGALVERSALLLRDGRSYVFRVAGDTVERVTVRVGLRNDRQVQVLTGIADADEVVIGDAVARLEPGMRIERSEGVSTARAEAAR